MTDNTSDTTSPRVDLKKRVPFFALVRFDEQTNQGLTVAATDIEHAKTLTREFFKDKRNVEIIDIYDMNEAPDMAEEPAPMESVPQNTLN